MRPKLAVVMAAAVLAGAALILAAGVGAGTSTPAAAAVRPTTGMAQATPGQDGGTTTGATPSSGVPTPHIIPRPDTGEEPHEAGDRGGALQLLLPVLLVVAVGGGAWRISRQGRAGREERRALQERPAHHDRPDSPDRQER